MSEANVPFNHPSRAQNGRLSAENQLEDQFEDQLEDQPESHPGNQSEHPNNPFTHSSLDQPDQLDRDCQTEHDRRDSPLSEAAAMAINSPRHSPSVSNNLREDLGTVAETWLHSTGSTDLSDLISLIQELNQCNSILLDRVSQLEEALERSQNALKAEVKRSQDFNFTDHNPANWGSVQDFALAQEQAIDLYQQLEAVHQTNQRQQILVETLTGQLESSQERVAQLEREAALVQQRYNDQSQRLIQAENNCRDLHARLHRQQRYTLQFKAALEKSLDVATPDYESVTEAVAASNWGGSFVPKVQHIQPWVSPDDISPARFPWMNLSGNLDTESSDADSEAGKAFDPTNLPIVRSRRSRLAAVKLPGFQPIDAPSFASSGKEPSGQETASHQSKQQSKHETKQQNSAKTACESVRESMVPDEQLLQKLDSVVQPLADLIADAMLSETREAGRQEIHQESHWDIAPEPSTPLHPVPPTVDATANLSVTAEEPASRSADDLLNSVMADAEDALWQDLARLIDVSTEEVVKASLSGDLSAFETIDFQALQGTDAAPAAAQDVPPWFGPESEIESTKKPSTSDWFKAEPAQPSAAEPQTQAHVPSQASASAFDNPGWPSPVVYPSRPAKKRRSLAAVDLPSFLQQAPGPLPT